VFKYRNLNSLTTPTPQKENLIMTEPKREKKTIYDLYNEVMEHYPDLTDQLEVALNRANEHNMKVSISLRTCSSITDDMELKVFKDCGRYFDCSIYPVSNMMKLPQKPKTYIPKGQTESKTITPKTILDGSHIYVISDLVDTFNREREEAAAARISKMKFIKEKLKGSNPMLYELIIKLFKHLIKTINDTVTKKEELDQNKTIVLERLKLENPDLKLEAIKWHTMTLDEIDWRFKNHLNAKQCRLFPSWYVETIKNPKFRPGIECNINLYCTEGVYESIGCGIIFYEMLRYVNADKYLIRNLNSILGSINIFTENSGFKEGQAIWTRKRNEYLAKMEEQAEKNRKQMEQKIV
jgi:hypothetical protein